MTNNEKDMLLTKSFDGMVLFMGVLREINIKMKKNIRETNFIN